MNSFYNCLRIGRIKKKLTGKEVIKDGNFKFSQTYLSMIENGKTLPSFAVVKKMAEFYGLDYEELLYLHKLAKIKKYKHKISKKYGELYG